MGSTVAMGTKSKPVRGCSPEAIIGSTGALAERSASRPWWKTWKATLGAYR